MTTNTKQLFESREESDIQLPTRNRLYAFSISELLDRQKSVKTHDELVKLAEEFKIDVNKLKNLIRFVSSPSVDKTSIRPAPGSKRGEDLWVANVGIILLLSAAGSNFFFCRLFGWKLVLDPEACPMDDGNSNLNLCTRI